MRSRDKRECGILLHISSLPSLFGIGSFGRVAYDFVDFLNESGQKLWQILPLVPIGEGNSPYKSCSCFAFETLYIDLELLVKDGLLTASEIIDEAQYSATDYSLARTKKLPLLRLAVERFDASDPDYVAFKKQNSWWLEDHALFVCALQENGCDRLCELPEELLYRMPSAIEDFRRKNEKILEEEKKLQFFAAKQYLALKGYANSRGIKLIGDIPFYISPDSAEVWTEPDVFRLGRDFTPVRVAGVPPDIFSSSGQLWGNPVYDWEYQRKTGYAWWRRRLRYCAELYDVLRIDHFRAFESFYTIPYGARDAKSGIWEKGPAMNFFKSVAEAIQGMRIIAEDLGGEEPEVEKLVEATGFPNMKVLQFAFSTDLANRFLPRNYPRNCVCYTGTHDNDTVLGWWHSATAHERLLFSRLSGTTDGSVPIKMITMALRSRADTVIIPMQDWLELNTDCRMNTPGTKDGNWQWRINGEALTSDLSQKLRALCRKRKE